jgi:hypothetical protein
MPLHPAAPEDLDGLVAAYQQTTQALIDLGHTCSPDDFALPTARQGWTVKDQIAHVVAGEPHHRAAVAAPKVVEELRTVADRRIRGLTEHPDTVAALRADVIEAWVAEQDVRQALGRPGDLDSGGAALTMDAIVRALPDVVVRRAAIAPGTAVILDATGPVVGRAGVLVEEDDSGGGARAVELFTGVAHEGVATAETTSIVLSTDALTRRAAGRISVEELHYTVHGDEDVARRVLEHLVLG